MNKKLQSTTLRLKWTKRDKLQEEELYGLRAGSLTLVGDKIYWADPEESLSVFSIKQWRWCTTRVSVPGLQPTDSAALCDDKIYFCGGRYRRYLIEYDVVLGSSRGIHADLVPPLYHQGMAVVFASWRREIIYFGGLKPMFGGILYDGTNAFNVDSHTWRTLKMRGDRPSPRVYHAAVLHGFHMYIFGGKGQTGEMYNDLWIAYLGPARPPFWSRPRVNGISPAPRMNASFHVLNGRFILFAGMDNSIPQKNDVHVLCPKTLEWNDCAGSAFVDIVDLRRMDLILHQGVATPAGILYFTLSHVLLLSEDTA